VQAEGLTAIRLACGRCGAEKPAGFGRRLCDICRDAPPPRDRAATGKCRRCGGPKAAGRGRRYCDTCRGFALEESYERVKERATAYNKAFPERRREYSKRWREANKETLKANQKEWRARTRERDREKRKAWALYQEYGMSLADFWALHTAQEGACAICQKRPTDPFTLHVDHCHETGKIRGLLCSPCNTGLGRFKDDPERLMKAARYLDGSSGVSQPGR
jgi:uncharacterized Zn finger protein (UPF0148 family)